MPPSRSSERANQNLDIGDLISYFPLSILLPRRNAFIICERRGRCRSIEAKHPGTARENSSSCLYDLTPKTCWHRLSNPTERSLLSLQRGPVLWTPRSSGSYKSLEAIKGNYYFCVGRARQGRKRLYLQIESFLSLARAYLALSRVISTSSFLEKNLNLLTGPEGKKYPNYILRRK